MDGSSPVADEGSARLTPMMAQYHAIKQRAGEALLFYRMGDFYELFFDDAVKAATALDITLTRRGKKDGEDIPMCGVPFHSADTYLARLIRKGFSVAICEQTEDPSEAKKRGAKSVVARDIIRVVTPGTVTEEALLSPRAPNFLAAIAVTGAGVALAAADLSTGEVQVEMPGLKGLAGAVAALSPAELLLPDPLPEEGSELLAALPVRPTFLPVHQFDRRQGAERLRAAYEVDSLDGFGTLSAPEVAALGALVGYLEITQCGTLPKLRAPRRIEAADHMAIDATTRRSLEITATAEGERKGSLLEAVDRTRTAAGGRLLARVLGAPLLDPVRIGERLDAVAHFHDDRELRERVTEALTEAPDAERALSRLTLGRSGPRDLAVIGRAIRAAGAIHDSLLQQTDGLECPVLIRQALEALAPAAKGELAAMAETLDHALDDDLPFLARDGGFVREGFDGDLDETRTLRTDARRVLTELEARYREETGVKSLKIRHSKVLGYFIEVTQANAPAITEGPQAALFRHRQTMANAMRFGTDELADLDSRIAAAAERSVAREVEIFETLRDDVLARHEALSAMAEALGWLDVLAGFAALATEEGYVRPRIDDSAAFHIEGGRHPVVEKALRREGRTESFIPNDCTLAEDGEPHLTVVTGPNMAGKSTFLRQNAVIAILAQAGSFVPARSAHIGVVDRLFSRVGASDNLARGQSTFMVEMLETAAILNQATGRSLVILDEVGRGTSTFDGMSIAWATLEHLHDRARCRGLFATHYHELTSLTSKLGRLRNISMAVREWKGDVVFLHEVQEGPADRSYGLAVAKLAGLPAEVTARAGEVLAKLEAGGSANDTVPELPLFAMAERSAPPPVEERAVPVPSACLDRLDEVSPDDLTPREALALLYDLKALRDRDGG